MNAALVYFLVLQGLAFLVWSILAFRWLFAIRAQAVAQSGSSWPGAAVQLQAFRDGFLDSRYRDHRRWLLMATAVLLVLAAISTQIVQ